MNIIFGQQIQFEYINYKGIKSTLNVIPMSLYFGATEFHPENQWLMTVYDLDKQCERTFALNDIVVGSFVDQTNQVSWKQHKTGVTHNPIPTQTPHYWNTHSKCFVCGKYHYNGNLPCPYGKFTSGE